MIRLNEMLKFKYCTHAILVVLFMVFGCSDDEPSPAPTPSDDSSDEESILNAQVEMILGTWEANKAIIQQIEEPANEIDILDEGGAGTLIVSPGNTFVLALLLLDGEGQVYTGEFVLDNTGAIALLFDNNPGDTIAWNVAPSSNALIFRGRAKYDFIGDGNLEDAFIDLDLDRSN